MKTLIAEDYLNQLDEDDKKVLRFLLNFEDDNYWKVVDMIPIPTIRAIENFKEGLYDGEFISKKCAKNYRKIKNCKECIHFFDCLDAGRSLILLAKGEKDDRR